MKSKISIIKTAGIALLMLFALSALAPAVSLRNPSDVLGHDFSESAFALEIDFNAGLGTRLNDLPATTEVVRDFTDPSNPAVRTTDSYENRDQQFFLVYVNQSGIETAYLALEKIGFDVNVSVASVTQRLFHVNGTMPFQSLFQHYTFGGKDVFILNEFNGLFAYTTTPDDPRLDENDTVLFGYTLAEEHLLNFIENGLVDNGLGSLPDWDVVADFTEESSSNVGGVQVSNYTWSITYKNLLVFWQEATGAPTSNIPGMPDSAARMVVFGDLVAMTLLDSLTFRFKAQVVAANDTFVKVNVITEYDIGSISLTIVRDDESTYQAIKNAFPDKINDSNSYYQPSAAYIIPSPIPSLPDVQVTLPGYAVYKDTAARARVNASTVAEGIGIGVLTSTNVYVAEYSVTLPSPIEDGQDIELPISVGGQTIFETDFKGKSTYNRDESIDGGQVYTDLPAFIDVIARNDVRIDSPVREYFRLQRFMSNIFGLYMARMVSPTLNAALVTDTEGAKVNMRVDDIAYFTLLQMPEWNGYPLTQDPTFSAVSVVSTAGGEGETSDNGGEGPSPSAPIPGFELLVVLGALPLVVTIRKRNRQ